MAIDKGVRSSSSEEKINIKEVKNILNNYNLLDDFVFVDEDVSNVTGEIESVPIDAAIFIGKNKDITKQVELMRSAVEKIYNGYQSAYDKSSYIEQFDIYPMKNFDQHMADLGARRSPNGIDFEPINKPVDWVAKVRDEIKSRLAEREKQELEEAVEEELAKQNKEADDVKNPEVKKAYIAAKKFLENVSDPKLSKLKDFKDPKDEERILLEILNDINDPYLIGRGFTPSDLKYMKSKLRPLVNLSDAQLKEELNKVLQENIDVRENQKGSKVNIEKQKKELEELKSKLKENPEGKVGAETQSHIVELEKKIKESEEKRSSLIKGQKIKQEEFDAMQKNIGTTFEHKYNKLYDGFTTAGPFCIEKRNYFRNVYRPSIDHFDTEFREGVPTKVTVKDEGNDIEVIKHKRGTGLGEQVSVEELTTELATNIDLNFTKTVKKNPLKYALENGTVIPVLDFNQFCFLTNNMIDNIFKNEFPLINKDIKASEAIRRLKDVLSANGFLKTEGSTTLVNTPDLLVQFLINKDTEKNRNKIFLFVYDIINRNEEFFDNRVQEFKNGYNYYTKKKKIGDVV